MQGGNTSVRVLNHSREFSKWRRWEGHSAEDQHVCSGVPSGSRGTCSVRVAVHEAGGNASGAGSGRLHWGRLRGASGLGVSPSVIFLSALGRLLAISLGDQGGGQRAVPTQKQEGHLALSSLWICPALIRFNECSSDSLLLKFRALHCSTEVYECLKTALRSPK